MKIRRIKTLPIEIFKTANQLNPNFMKIIFTSKTNSLGNSRNILNRGQVRFASAKCAHIFTNYERSLVIIGVFRHLRIFAKQR